MHLPDQLLSLVAELLDALECFGDLIFGGLLDLIDPSGALEAALSDDLGVIVAATSIPGQQVGSISRNIRQGPFCGNLDQSLLELLGRDLGDGELRVLGRLERQVVGKQTTNVWRSHGGTGDGVDSVLGADPGGKNVQTRRKNISALAIVGEVCASVIDSRGANSDGEFSSGR